MSSFENIAPIGEYRVVHFNGEGAGKNYTDYGSMDEAVAECDRRNRMAKGSGSTYSAFDDAGNTVRDNSAIIQSEARVDLN